MPFKFGAHRFGRVEADFAIRLIPAHAVQGDLWDAPDSASRQRLMRALDTIIADYGPRHARLCLVGAAAGLGAQIRVQIAALHHKLGRTIAGVTSSGLRRALNRLDLIVKWLHAIRTALGFAATLVL